MKSAIIFYFSWSVIKYRNSNKLLGWIGSLRSFIINYDGKLAGLEGEKYQCEEKVAGLNGQNCNYDVNLAGVKGELAGSKRAHSAPIAGGWRSGQEPLAVSDRGGFLEESAEKSTRG